MKIMIESSSATMKVKRKLNNSFKMLKGKKQHKSQKAFQNALSHQPKEQESGGCQEKLSHVTILLQSNAVEKNCGHILLTPEKAKQGAQTPKLARLY